MMNVEICLDCLEDGHLVTTVLDTKWAGRVCPRCERIYSFTGGSTGDKRYTTKPKAMIAMRYDAKRSRHKYNSTRAMVERLLRPTD
jgi:hypothetical protein